MNQALATAFIETKPSPRIPVSFVSREKDLLVLSLVRSGRYSTTRDGKIMAHYRGAHRVQARPISQWADARGYLRAALATGAHRPSQIIVYVHRVIALATLG